MVLLFYILTFTSQDSAELNQEAMFEELFKAASIGEEGSKQFQDAMSLLMGQEPELAQQIQKLAQAAGNAGVYVWITS